MNAVSAIQGIGYVDFLWDVVELICFSYGVFYACVMVYYSLVLGLKGV